MTYEDYCAEAEERGYVAMSETSFHAWMATPTHYIATDVPTRATPLLTPDPLAAQAEPTTHYQRVTDDHGNVVAWLPVVDTEPPTTETWRDRAPLL